MVEHKVSEVGPIWFPWQRVKRAIATFALVILPAVNLLIPQLVEAFNGNVSPELFAWINGVALATLAVVGIVTRIIAIPTINEWLVNAGLGSVPKSAVKE